MTVLGGGQAIQSARMGQPSALKGDARSAHRGGVLELNLLFMQRDPVEQAT